MHIIGRSWNLLLARAEKCYFKTMWKIVCIEKENPSKSGFSFLHIYKISQVDQCFDHSMSFFLIYSSYEINILSSNGVLFLNTFTTIQNYNSQLYKSKIKLIKRLYSSFTWKEVKLFVKKFTIFCYCSNFCGYSC